MAINILKRLRFIRGNTSAIEQFTGYSGELTVNTDTWTVQVHDGVTPGGNNLAASSEIPVDISDLTDEQGLLGQISSTSFEHLAVTGRIAATEPVISFTKEPNTQDSDLIDEGLELTRPVGVGAGLINIAQESTWDTESSPAGTEWNWDGWDNLDDVKLRSYASLRQALRHRIGQNIVGAELVMHDINNDQYYKIQFSSWAQGAAHSGAFAYTRQLIDTDKSVGINFADGSVMVKSPKEFVDLPQIFSGDTNEYIVGLGDRGKHIYAFTESVIKIPSDSQVNFPLGSTIFIVTGGFAENRDVKVSCSSPTVIEREGLSGSTQWSLKPYSTAILIKIADDKWNLSGSIEIPEDISDLTDTQGLLGQGGGNITITEEAYDDVTVHYKPLTQEFTYQTTPSRTVLPFVEVTNNPFIIQPVILGEPVTVTAPASGQDATFEVVIGAGPVIDTFTIVNPGTGYVTGQQYKIWYYNIGGNVLASDIIFEVATVGESGDILTVTNAAFAGAANNNPGTYSGVSIELTSSVRDEISPGVVLTRSAVQGLCNIISETEYDNDTYTSPVNTEWNTDGWNNLEGVRDRTFTTFRSALDGQVGNNIVAAELVMRDTTTDKYYKFDFSSWGQNNGGSYSYTRTEITDPNYFVKTDYGSEVDTIIPDDGEGAGVAITRGNNNGIYNPYREGTWTSEVSPGGTLWNIDGWNDLTDVESRTYNNFYDTYDGNLGNRVPGSKAIMFVPDNGKYYAIQWLSWTQGGNGGGFSYTRNELDLAQLRQGVKFPDGTVLTSAAGLGRVKSTASNGRRIEEAVGSNTVSVTAVNTVNITATASRSVVGDNRFWVSNTATDIAAIMNNNSEFGIQDQSTIQLSLDNSTWYTYSSSYSGTSTEIGVQCSGGPFTYNEGDTIYFRYDTGGAPQVWWNKNDLPSGGNNFRGAVIDYHAYTGEGTFIGTIHIVDDNGEEHISHTEVASGSTDSENDDLWLVQNEGTISYRRIDGEANTLKILWTAKVFYGTEYYD